MAAPFNYMPTPEEEKKLLPYVVTIIVGANDGTGVSREYLFPALTSLWLEQERCNIPLDVSFSLNGPQSFHLIRVLNQLEKNRSILRVCIACGRYTIKPTPNVPPSDYYPHLCVKAAKMYGKIKTLCQGGKQWTTNVFCGLFSKGGGMELVLSKQSEFARIKLNPNNVVEIINSLYAPIVGRTLVI